MANPDPPVELEISPSESDPRVFVVRIRPQGPGAESPQPLTVDDAIATILKAMEDGTGADLKGAFDVIALDKSGAAYRRVLDAVLEVKLCSDAFRDAFHLDWSVRGFRYREPLKDDALLIRAFRKVFPPYFGEPIILYRGERASELDVGRLGLNWTPNVQVAQRFASRLCRTYGCDGVVLRATAPAEAIIALPNQHSSDHLEEEDEHIVDPSFLLELTELRRFPPDPSEG